MVENRNRIVIDYKLSMKLDVGGKNIWMLKHIGRNKREIKVR